MEEGDVMAVVVLFLLGSTVCSPNRPNPKVAKTAGQTDSRIVVLLASAWAAQYKACKKRRP